MFGGLRLKIFLTYMSIVLLVIVLLNYLPGALSRSAVEDAKKVELFTSANIMASTILARFDDAPGAETPLSDAVSVKESYEVLSIDRAQRVIVCDRNLRVVFDSASRGSLNGQRLLLRSVYSALQGQEVFKSYLHKEAYEFSAAVPLRQNGTLFGTVYIYEYSTEQASSMADTSRTLALLSVLIVLLSLILSFIFTAVFTEQIRSINVAVRHMKAGIYDRKARVISKDELGELAKEFNQLSDRLWETEEDRRQFIANASHELKTPLAAIKLLSDSILETPQIDPSTAREFLTDIGGEIDRLTRITDQLLKLTKMDMTTEYQESPVALTPIVEKTVTVLRPLAASRELKMDASIQKGCVILGDEDRTAQIVMNLVENAIKYNKEKGSLTVRLTKGGGRVVFRVTDTGIGIPKDDLERIFERFYRVDKAHSRATGGTGLGLSIVKSNAESMGADIRVTSELGRGSDFTVTFRAAGKKT